MNNNLKLVLCVIVFTLVLKKMYSKPKICKSEDIDIQMKLYLKNKI